MSARAPKTRGAAQHVFTAALFLLFVTALLLALVAGVGVGTVVSAVIVGRIVNVLNRHLPLLAHIAHLTRSDAGAPEEAL